MPDIYAQIDDTSTVVNLIMAKSTDPFDPAYTWVIVTNRYCADGVSPIQIGCTYDGTNFYPAIGE
jgi:hypothetical protein